MKHALSLSLCAAVFALHPVYAVRQAPAAQEKREQHTLHVTTRLVQVDVIVQDKKGEPARDLTRDDFVLLDGGREQEIKIFSRESNAQAGTTLESLPPNTFSNRRTPRGNTPTSVTVLLLDALNTSFNDQAYAKDELIQFLRQIQPGDRVGIYLLTKNLSVLHDFSSDASSLVRALEHYQGYVSREFAASDPAPIDVRMDHRDLPDQREGAEDIAARELNQFILSSQQRIADVETANRVRGTLQALEAIANHVSHLPGRKNLIWLSGGFPFSMGLQFTELGRYSSQDSRTFSGPIERTARAVNNANLAIYPVDARGLIGAFSKSPIFDGADGSRAKERGGLASDPLMVGRLGPAGENPNTVKIDQTAANFGTMNLLADRTGGRAFYNSNDIRGAIRRAIDDSRLTYVLGYYPSHDEWNGNFREIQIKVKRPGLQVHHRRGYLALLEGPVDKNQRVAVVRDAAASPLDAGRLGLTAHIVREKTSSTGAATLQLKIDPRDLRLEERNGDWIGGLDLLLVQRSANGQQVDTFAHTQPLNFTHEAHEMIMHTGLVLNLKLEIKPTAHQLRVAVRDVSSDAVGSLSIPLTGLSQDSND